MTRQAIVFHDGASERQKRLVVVEELPAFQNAFGRVYVNRTVSLLH